MKKRNFKSTRTLVCGSTGIILTRQVGGIIQCPNKGKCPRCVIVPSK